MLISIGFINKSFGQKSKVEGLSDSTELINTRIERMSFSSKPKVAMPEPDLTPPEKTLEYNPIETNHKPLVAQPKMNVKLLDKPKWEKLKNGSVKLGLGLYLTPLARLNLNGGRDTKKDWGLEINHLSSLLGHTQYATFGETFVGAKGRFILDNHTIFGSVGFKNHSVNAYGVQRDSAVFEKDDFWKKAIGLNNNRIQVNFGLKKNGSPSDLLYSGEIRLRQFSDNFKNSEFYCSVIPGGEVKIADSLKLKGLAEFTFGSVGQTYYNGGKGRGIFFMDLTPHFTYYRSFMRAEVGIRLASASDTAKSNFGIYPDIHLEFFPSKPFFSIYAGVKGRTILNQRADLEQINPYLDRTAFVKPTFEIINTYAGIKGSFEGLNYDVRFLYRKVENQVVFRTVSADSLIEYQPLRQGFFGISYEKKFTEMGINAQVTYDMEQEFMIGAKVDYRKYTLEDLKHYFGTPAFSSKIWGSYIYDKKLTLSLGLNLIGSRPVGYRIDGTLEDQPLFADLNFEARYQISKSFSAFLEANNILNQKYYRWQFYAERRLDFRAGIMINF